MRCCFAHVQEPQDLSGLFTTELKRFREMSTSVYDPKTHPSSVKFRKCLEDDGNSVSDGQTQGISDGDIVVEQVQQSLNCPLTKRLLEAPVTSKVCKHSYSYSAIIEHIRKRSEINYLFDVGFIIVISEEHYTCV